MSANNTEYTSQRRVRTTEERVQELKSSGCSDGTVRCYLKVNALIDNCIRVAAASQNQQSVNC